VAPRVRVHLDHVLADALPRRAGLHAIRGLGRGGPRAFDPREFLEPLKSLHAVDRFDVASRTLVSDISLTGPLTVRRAAMPQTATTPFESLALVKMRNWFALLDPTALIE
jgi:hypothetical protein